MVSSPVSARISLSILHLGEYEFVQEGVTAIDYSFTPDSPGEYVLQAFISIAGESVLLSDVVTVEDPSLNEYSIYLSISDPAPNMNEQVQIILSAPDDALSTLLVTDPDGSVNRLSHNESGGNEYGLVPSLPGEYGVLCMISHPFTENISLSFNVGEADSRLEDPVYLSIDKGTYLLGENVIISFESASGLNVTLSVTEPDNSTSILEDSFMSSFQIAYEPPVPGDYVIDGLMSYGSPEMTVSLDFNVTGEIPQTTLFELPSTTIPHPSTTIFEQPSNTTLPEPSVNDTSEESPTSTLPDNPPTTILPLPTTIPVQEILNATIPLEEVNETLTNTTHVNLSEARLSVIPGVCRPNDTVNITVTSPVDANIMVYVEKGNSTEEFGYDDILRLEIPYTALHVGEHDILANISRGNASLSLQETLIVIQSLSPAQDPINITNATHLENITLPTNTSNITTPLNISNTTFSVNVTNITAINATNVTNITNITLFTNSSDTLNDTMVLEESLRKTRRQREGLIQLKLGKRKFPDVKGGRYHIKRQGKGRRNLGDGEIGLILRNNDGVIDPSDYEARVTAAGDLELNFTGTRAFRPGLYRVELSLTEGGVNYTLEQNFTWGVLAFNTHKSRYLENETARLAMAVLDDAGKMVCDANVTVIITDPVGERQLLETPDGIRVTDACMVYDATEDPDYIAEYMVGSPGTYVVNMTAWTDNGERTMIDSFQVVGHTDYDVSRTHATRIYPDVDYDMVLTVRANRDYQGEILEILPSMLSVYGNGFRAVEAGEVKILRFPVDLKEGDEVNLTYTIDYPDISPYFYLIGKLEIGSWTESRYWQIASDATTETADSESITQGDAVSGTYANTQSDDGSSRQIDEHDTRGGGQVDYEIDVEYGFNTAVSEGDVTQIEVSCNTWTGDTEAISVYLYDYDAPSWQDLGFNIAQTSDSTTYTATICESGCDVTDDPADYIDGSGNLNLRYHDDDTSENTQTRVYFDYHAITLTHGEPATLVIWDETDQP
ncbi:hypothetical protein ACFLRF_04345, partial [Candidatus Altiarchaeota archaeon]